LGFLLGAVAGATLGGRLTLHVVYAKRIPIVGSAISGLALIAAGAMVAQKSLVALELMLLLIGIGMGMTFPVTTVSVQNAVHQMHLGVATGMLTFLRSLGGALGVAVLGAIALGHGIPLGAEAGGHLFHVSDPEPFAVLYYTMAAIMLVAAAIYGLMPHKELRGLPEPAGPTVE
jgi:MFS family permease